MFFLSKFNCYGTLGSMSEIISDLTNRPIEFNSFMYNSVQSIDKNSILLSPQASNSILRNSFVPKIRIEFYQEKICFVFFLSAIKRLFIFLIFILGELGFISAFLLGTLADDAKFLIVFPIILFVLFNIIFEISVKKLQNQLSERIKNHPGTVNVKPE